MAQKEYKYHKLEDLPLCECCNKYHPTAEVLKECSTEFIIKLFEIYARDFQMAAGTTRGLIGALLGHRPEFKDSPGYKLFKTELEFRGSDFDINVGYRMMEVKPETTEEEIRRWANQP